MRTEAKAETSKEVKTLITLTKGMQVGKQTICFDPTALFLRLIFLIERADDTMKFFSHELTSIPTFLFKDNFRRHAEKS